MDRYNRPMQNTFRPVQKDRAYDVALEISILSPSCLQPCMLGSYCLKAQRKTCAFFSDLKRTVIPVHFSLKNRIPSKNAVSFVKSPWKSESLWKSPWKSPSFHHHAAAHRAAVVFPPGAAAMSNTRRPGGDSPKASVSAATGRREEAWGMATNFAEMSGLPAGDVKMAIENGDFMIINGDLMIINGDFMI